MEFFRKCKGAVSIFLVLILVPVIVVCTVFIDVSRMKLAQGLAYSSGDLALNTVLSQYDTELSDYYGLMASSQNIDEFYDTAEDYFTACMISQGVDTTNAQKWGHELKNIFKDDASVNDFIGIDTSKTTAEVESVDQADLANAAMMKNEITEFMKYRAPAQLLEDGTNGKKGLVKKLTGVEKNMQSAPAEAVVQSAKTKFYDKENELLQKSLEVYEVLQKYEKLGIDDEYMQAMQKDMETLVANSTDPNELSYYNFHRLYVSNWCNTDGYEQFKSVKTQVDAGNKTTASGENLAAGTVGIYIRDYEKSLETYKNARTALQNVIAGIPYAGLSSEEANHVQYWVQMVDDMGDSYQKYVDALVDLNEKYNNLLFAYDNRDQRDKVVGYDAEGNEIKEPYDAGDETYSYSDEGSITDAYGNAMTSAQSNNLRYGDSSINTISQNIETYSKEALSQKLTDRGEAKKKIQEAVKDLQARYAVILEGKGYLTTVQGDLPELTKLVGKYDDAYQVWKNDVEKYSGVGSDLIKSDKEEIDKLEANQGKYDPKSSKNELTRINIKEDDVTALKEGCGRIVSLFDSYMDTAVSIQYRGTTVFGTLEQAVNTAEPGIYSFEALDMAAKNAKGSCVKENVDPEKIPVKQTELDTYINNTYETTDKINEMTAISSSNSPFLHPGATKDYAAGTKVEKSGGQLAGATTSAGTTTSGATVSGATTSGATTSDTSAEETKKPSLYAQSGTYAFDCWLHAKFDGLEFDSEGTKGILKQMKEMLAGLADQATANLGKYDNEANLSTEEIDKEANLPSKGKAAKDTASLADNSEKDLEKQLDNSASYSSSGDNAFNNIDFGGLLSSGRDNLYATTYIMNMFSYETYQLEGMYNNAQPSKENIYQLTTPSMAISPKNAKDLYDNPTYLGNKTSGWKNQDLTQSYNKSLTNKMIAKMGEDGSGNNWSYGNEVEYILYGGSNKENKEKMDTSLYFTRYALNMAPVFTKYWSNRTVERVATAVAAATEGIIPVSLTKMLICLGVVAAETAIDYNYLKAGLPVIFAKKTQYLFLKLDIADPDALALEIESKSADGTKLVSCGNRVVPDNVVTFSYSDYLSFYLFIKLGCDPDSIYLRTADVIQANQLHNPNITSYTDGFQMSKAKTYFNLATSVRVKPMMVTLPYAQQNGAKVLTDTDTWNTFTYKATRGY